MKPVRAALLGSLLLAFSAYAETPWSIALRAGHGQHVDVLDVGLRTPDLRLCSLSRDWQLALSLLGTVGYWHGQDHTVMTRDLWDLGLTPMLRLRPQRGPNIFVPFFEAGVGAHFVTHTRVNGTRELGTGFQFGEVIGAGMQFGSRLQYELGVRLHHESNANLASKNDGLTYVSIGVAYSF
jgi:hypothetical protein